MNVSRRLIAWCAVAVVIAAAVIGFAVMQVRANSDKAHDSHCREAELYAALSHGTLPRECR